MAWKWGLILESIGIDQLRQLLNQRLTALEAELSQIAQNNGGVFTWAAGDTTPSVGVGALFLTDNAVPCTITALDDGAAARRISIVFLDANTTLQHGANLQLNGDDDFTGAVGDVREFVTADGTTWYDVGRPTTLS